MTRILTILSVLLLLLQTPDSSSQTLRWDDAYGGSQTDGASGIVTLPDSSLVITGYTSSQGAGLLDVLLLKVDKDGAQDWIKTFGGSSDDQGYDVLLTKDSNLVIVGYSKSFTPTSQMYIIKTDLNGNLIWGRIYGGGADEYGYSVEETEDGAYIVAGETYSFGAGADDIYLTRIEANGNQSWTKFYGGPGADWATDIAKVDSDGFIVAGNTNSFGTGNRDIYLLRLDADGDTIWTRTYGSSGMDGGEAVLSIPGTGYLVGGLMYRGLTKGYDAELVSFDSDGGLLWESTVGGAGNQDIESLTLLPNGRVIAAGKSSASDNDDYDVLYMKVYIDGDSVSTNTFGGDGDDRAWAVTQADDEGVVLAGYTYSFGSGRQAYLVRVDHDFLCGDTDGNGKYQVSDVVYTIAYIFGGGDPPYPLKSGDYDCSGAVNMADVVAMIAWMFGDGNPPCDSCEPTP
jgi:hypothetical protein